METLTREERLVVTRCLTEPRSRLDTVFTYAIYFVPSVLFGIYGILKADFLAVALGYLVLLGLMFYLISYQRRSAPLLRSALLKLVEEAGAMRTAAPAPASSD